VALPALRVSGKCGMSAPRHAMAVEANANGEEWGGQMQAELGWSPGDHPYVTRLYGSRRPVFRRTAREARRREGGVARQTRHMPASISPDARGPPHTSQKCNPR